MRGYTATWEVRTVDASTWSDSDTLSGVTSISISRDCTDDVPLLETGEMEFDGASEFGWAWCRIYLAAKQSGTEKYPVATLLFEKASTRHEYGTSTMRITGRSVLQPAADRKLPYGTFAAAGTDGAAYAARLISECTPAPVVVDGSFSLAENIVFDLGSSNLKAAWQLLNAGGWCLQIGGDGTIYVRELPSEPELELSAVNAGLLIPGIDDDYSIIDIPNRYYAIDDDEMAVATNEDPESETGYQQRGRWVDEVDSSPSPLEGETLEAYAIRKLKEASTVTRTYSYDREWWPGITTYSLVRATLERNGISGLLRVRSQNLECGAGIVVSETVGEEVVA